MHLFDTFSKSDYQQFYKVYKEQNYRITITRASKENGSESLYIRTCTMRMVKESRNTSKPMNKWQNGLYCECVGKFLQDPYVRKRELESKDRYMS